MVTKELQRSPVNRRGALLFLASFISSMFVFGFRDVAMAGRGVLRRHRRRVRRRVRRRIRRRLTLRTVAGRRVWLAPVALAVGWELVLNNNRVVVVKETKFVERNGAKKEVIVVQDAEGKTEELEIVRENTAENSKDLQGSILPENDKTTPAIESEEKAE